MKKFTGNFIRSRFSKHLFLDEPQKSQGFNGSRLSKNLQVANMSEGGSKPVVSSSSSQVEGNLLKSEKSPYLLQHKSNPVHWYSWNEEAFAVARGKKKPIFLSVGYSTCHWCHVMERESFENEDVAKVMNEHFVNVKMDREEHPDLDRIYMTFVQAVSGSGGWPMSVWMTPDLKPFYGGTYYPANDSWGRPGFKSLLLTIAEQWDENSEKFYASAEKIMSVLQRTATLPVSETLPEAVEIAKKCYSQLSRSYEPAFGGFSDHPKFPQPVNINFMIYFNKANPDVSMSLQMAERTLKGIAKGGIHDHVGKGFCRYSTDRKWHVPHFEKMLYDNAQLSVAYTNMYLLTGDSYYAALVEDIFEYINRDMSHNEGGFYSAEDADSYPEAGAAHKTEGAFYAYTQLEIEVLFDDDKVNGVKKHEIFNWRYGVREEGNVDPRGDPHGELKGKNVLYLAHTYEETARHFKISVEDAKDICNEGEKLLFDYRNANRPRPGLDTKFIASWNGLMISAFARAGAALGNSEHIARAEKAMTFVEKYLKSPTGEVFRTCYREGDDNSSQVVNFDKPILGCVDDFANLVSASLDLFDATSKLEHLERAIQLQKTQDEIFWDSESGGYFNGRQSPHNIVRFKDDDDGAEPSSNSVSVVNLIRLHSITDNRDYGDKVVKLFHQFGDRLGKLPITLPMMTTAYTSYSSGAKLLLVISKNQEASEQVSRLRNRLLPLGSTVIILNPDKCSDLDKWKQVTPYLAEKIEDFNLRADTSPENIYLRQGQRFTHSCDKDEFENILSAL